jgi:S1-C subfamily serine protease
MYPLDAAKRSGGSSGNEIENQGPKWTGTGFALRNGYIVTNNHVVEGASSIVVQGVNGNSVEYKAEVVAVDKNNDLALIRINDYRFDGFGTIPYSIKETLCDVGSDVFVLGYPLTTYMGEEIKLTNGIISARSGYQGDVTTYQISAPVQPGNSGGPMFDRYGNVIGVVNAGIPGAENVGYAIKASYLCSLINAAVSDVIIPRDNTIATKSLPEKVKILRNYTFYIKCR